MMSINPKPFGLAIVAAFTISAVIVSIASAQTLEAEPETPTGFVTGTSTGSIFTLGSTSVPCGHAEFSGSFVSPTKTLSVTPKYTGCELSSLQAHVLDTGCSFELLLRNEHSNNLETGKSDVRLECGSSAEGHIVITPTLFGFSHCTFTFGEQNINGSLTITVNTASPDDLIIDKGTIGSSTPPTGIKYTVTKSGVGCPAIGSYQNGSDHISTTTVRFFKESAHKEAVGVQLVTR